MRLLALLAGVFATAVSAGDSLSQTRQVPDTAAEIQLSFAPIVKSTAPAVVNVYASRMVRQRATPFFDDPFFRHFFGQPEELAPRRRMQSSLGSGVIVDDSGIVVTNHHVIRGADQVKIALSDRREFDCEIVLKDERTDLAILKVKDRSENLPAIRLGDTGSLEVGDLVLAIGNPFGVGQTVTQGIVSALARTKVGVTDYQFFIQTDAAINPGNSGGALVDMQGRLVGINTAIYSRSGGSNGIGFAIPISMVRLVVDSARNGGGRVRRPWFGAGVQTVTSDIADSLGLDRPRGILVTSVESGSPAGKAGLRRGDLIVAIDDVNVDDPQGFGYRYATKRIGGSTKISILRRGRGRDIQVALIPAPETTPRDTRKIGGYSPFAGATVVNLSPAVAEELSFDRTEGVAVTGIERGSQANRIGLQPGDVVVEVNGLQISDTAALERAASEKTRFWRMTIDRNGQQMSMAFRG